MPRYAISSGIARGPIVFSESQWVGLEKAARISFSEERRKEIEDAALNYFLVSSRSAHEFEVAEIERHIKEAIRSAKTLQRLLSSIDSDVQSAERSAMTLIWQDNATLEQLDGWKSHNSEFVEPLIAAAEAAYIRLPELSVKSPRGPRGAEEFSDFVLRLAEVFKKTGKQPSIGTRRRISRGLQESARRGSPFCDFVHGVYSNLRGEVESRRQKNEPNLPALRRRSPTSIANIIHKKKLLRS